MHSVTELDARGKRVLVRLDLDVPLKNNKIIDDTRLKLAIPTLKLLLKQKAILILIGHRGRPHGKRTAELSLKPVCKHLANLLNTPIEFVKKAKNALNSRK
ncbi:MAG: phosphoglycerate kinase, partial [Candidatus Woesearchaeota archaeon]|nr:phosphoglycerate kinase [Candidatus Woesearchaeota archaeon]